MTEEEADKVLSWLRVFNTKKVRSKKEYREIVGFILTLADEQKLEETVHAVVTALELRGVHVARPSDFDGLRLISSNVVVVYGYYQVSHASRSITIMHLTPSHFTKDPL